jgi:hypothetical protein
MSKVTTESELAELRAQLALVERSISGIREGQVLQQRGIEGMEAALVARLAAIEAQGGSRGQETLLGLTLECLRGDQPIETASRGLAHTAEYRSIVLNRKILSALEWQSQRRSSALDDEGVLQVARAAGDWSCMHHPGVFASRRIEGHLRTCGRRLLADLGRWSRGSGRRHVLHVMTVAHPIGGHTRLAERWIRLDPGSSHAVALTEQGELEVPASLVRSAEGGVHTLSAGTPGARVQELAKRAREFDLVLLHIHPYDAVAVAAFGDTDRRAPTVLVDHGDHIFWLGTGAADTVVSVRPSGATLVIGRRGIAADRNIVIPLPLDPVTRQRTRSEAKRELGLPPDALVMLTVASAHKYAAVGAQSFTALAHRVMETNDRALLLAIGPDTTDSDWDALARRFPGRVRANGPSTETTVAREAADVYLDSFPFGSPTSLFEAALYETPAVILRPPGVGVLAVEDPDADLIDAVDGDSWVDTVSTLLREDARREHEGRRLAEAIRASHRAETIASLIANTSDGVRRGSASLNEAIPEMVGTFDVALVAYQDASGLGRPVEDLLIAHGLLPRLA